MGTTSRGWPLPDGNPLPRVWLDLAAMANAASLDLDGFEGDIRPRLEDLESFGLDGNELRSIAQFSGGANTSVTTIASGIPAGYETLMLIWRGGSSLSNVGASLSLRFNGQSSGYAGFNGWASASSGWTLQDESSGSILRAGFVGASPGSCGIIWIPYYTNPTGGSILAVSFARGIAGSSVTHAFGFGVGVRGSGAVSSIQLWPAASTWDSSGVRASLIGIK